MIAQVDGLYARTRPAKALGRYLSYTLFEGQPVTRKGKFVNPLVFSLLRTLAVSPFEGKVDRPVFIVGMGRSGSTLLGVLLSMHEEVGFLDEPKAMWHVAYPEEDVLGAYGEGRARFVLLSQDATPEVVDRARNMFGRYLSLTRAARLVDKYPELVFRVPFVIEIFPDARFVLLARNAWDVCDSVPFWSRRHRKTVNGAVHDWWGVDRNKWHLMVDELVPLEPALARFQQDIRGLADEAEMAAVEWVLTMRKGLQVMQEHSDRTTLVRYEDLASRPREELGRLAEVLGLSHDEVFLQFGERAVRPVNPHDRRRLSPFLLSAVETTLQDLGYDA